MDAVAGAIAGLFVLIIAALAVALGKRKPVPVLTLPHPEEPARDWQRTSPIGETDHLFESVFWEFIAQWGVPASEAEALRNTTIWEFYDEWPQTYLDWGLQPNTPACAWTDGDGYRHSAYLAKWAVPGVMAHEAGGHGAWFQQSEPEHVDFEDTYQTVKDAPLIVLLWSINTYGLSSPVERHAELYRYLGTNVPEPLKRFYPRLFV